MENPANPVATESWWKKGMSLKQLGIYLAISLFFVFAGYGISYLLEQQNKKGAPTAPAMAALPAVDLTLDVINPTEAMVVQEKLIKVTGKTLPNTSLVVFGQTRSSLGLSDNEGNFEIDYELGEGINTLTVTAVSSDGQEETKITEVILGGTSKLGSEYEEQPI